MSMEFLLASAIGTLTAAGVYMTLRARTFPVIIGLALLSFRWTGWLLWTVIILVIGLYHPPVYDERTPLDARRIRVAWLGLAVFVLTFMPVPFDILPVP